MEAITVISDTQLNPHKTALCIYLIKQFIKCLYNKWIVFTVLNIDTTRCKHITIVDNFAEKTRNVIIYRHLQEDKSKILVAWLCGKRSWNIGHNTKLQPHSSDMIAMYNCCYYLNDCFCICINNHRKCDIILISRDITVIFTL